jgi:glycine/D-amino acid oxidase-like deaminating enzyme
LNGLEVEAIETDEIRTTAGFSFKAKHIVVTTNGFAKTLLPELNVEPARAQVLVTEPIPGLKLKGTFHYDKGYYYFRNIGNRVLFGGGRNMDFSGENTVEMSQTPLIQGKLEQLLSEMIVPYSEVKIDLRWSGIMGVGQERNPIVKKLSDHLYCGVRMGGMGVAIGSLVGKEIAEMISVEENA